MLAGRRQLSLDETGRRRLRRQTSETRPILAWQSSTESLGGKPNSQVEVVAKKIGQPKPAAPARPVRSPSIKTESCLTLSRRQVAERLRVGWSKAVAKEGQDKRRQNINIFLNKSFESRPESPKTPELGNEGYIRSQSFLLCDQDDVTDSSSDSDSSSEDEVPIAVINPPPARRPPPPQPSPTPPPSRPPLSASARRAVFKASGRQKPTTCSSPEPRPRLMSAPPQPPVRPPSAERSRSAPPRRPRKGAKTKPRRGVEGGEVITMVSLVSPAESEDDELLPNIQCPPTPEVPSSPERVLIIPNPPSPPILSLRRPQKAVTFKSCSVDGPQFRTSYPVRSPTILQEESEEKLDDPKETVQSEEEKQSSVQKIAAAKTTVQTKQTKNVRAPLPKAQEKKRVELKKRPIPTNIPEPIEEETSLEPVAKETAISRTEDSQRIEEVAKSEEVDPDFKSAKERECWQLFKRMSSRGVSVSFETVLRGLLTPTEYRLRRAALMASC